MLMLMHMLVSAEARAGKPPRPTSASANWRTRKLMSKLMHMLMHMLMKKPDLRGSRASLLGLWTAPASAGGDAAGAGCSLCSANRVIPTWVGTMLISADAQIVQVRGLAEPAWRARRLA